MSDQCKLYTDGGVYGTVKVNTILSNLCLGNFFTYSLLRHVLDISFCAKFDRHSNMGVYT